jgi:hypothetical protein
LVALLDEEHLATKVNADPFEDALNFYLCLCANNVDREIG